MAFCEASADALDAELNEPDPTKYGFLCILWWFYKWIHIFNDPFGYAQPVTIWESESAAYGQWLFNGVQSVQNTDKASNKVHYVKQKQLFYGWSAHLGWPVCVLVGN